MSHRKVFITSAICGLVFSAGCSNPFTWRDNSVNLLATGMAGWEVVNGPADSWKFDNGVLYTDGSIERYGSWISTKQQYSDFLLELEFNISPGGNSGVFIRAPRAGDAAYEGMEIQILDDRAEGLENLKPWQFTGAVYDVAAPRRRATKQAKLWQTMVIYCKDNIVRVQINGDEVVDLDLNDAQSKSGRPHPGLQRREGYIGFQNHKSPVEFRNVRITDLSLQL
jgi:hypothetical protein